MFCCPRVLARLFVFHLGIQSILCHSVSYNNPIIPGWHSDPSCVFVAEWGNTTFCTASSFLAFPGCPVFASKDLIHWKLASNAVNRVAQLPQLQTSNNNQGLGLFASTLRYHNHTLYLITAWINSENPGSQFFIFTTSDAFDDSAWSHPLLVKNIPARTIDPDIFWDDDGQVIMAFAGEPTQASYLDLLTGNASGQFDLWNGTGHGTNEGPHLFKKDGFYYLLLAEGGTQLNHSAVLARSRSLHGPWESLPTNPFLTNRGTEEYFQTVGHADIFPDAAGNWWGVALSTRGGPTLYSEGVYPMGRETVLYPVTWPTGGWPIASPVRGLMHGPLPPATPDIFSKAGFGDRSQPVKFAPGSSLPNNWVYWRAPAKPESFIVSPPGHPNTLQLTASQQNLTGDSNFQALDGITFLAERQVSTLFSFSVDVDFGFQRAAEDECGVSSFLNRFQHADLGIVYLASRSKKKLTPNFRFRATTFGKTNVQTPLTRLIPIPTAWQGSGPIRLPISTVNQSHFQFSAARATQPEKPIHIAVFNTSFIGGDGSGSGGLLGVFATANGGSHTMIAYIRKWFYHSTAQQIDYKKFAKLAKE